MDYDVELAPNAARWLATDDRAAGQRFFLLHRALESECLNATGAGKYRYHRGRLAPAIPGLETSRRRQSDSGDQFDDRQLAVRSPGVVRDGGVWSVPCL